MNALRDRLELALWLARSGVRDRLELALWRIGFYRYCVPCDTIARWWGRGHRDHLCGFRTFSGRFRA